MGVAIVIWLVLLCVIFGAKLASIAWRALRQHLDPHQKAIREIDDGIEELEDQLEEADDFDERADIRADIRERKDLIERILEEQALGEELARLNIRDELDEEFDRLETEHQKRMAQLSAELKEAEAASDDREQRSSLIDEARDVVERLAEPDTVLGASEITDEDTQMLPPPSADVDLIRKLQASIDSDDGFGRQKPSRRRARGSAASPKPRQ